MSSKLTFHKVYYHEGEYKAMFYIDNFTSKEFLELKTLEELSNMPITDETVKAYKALKEVESKLTEVYK